MAQRGGLQSYKQGTLKHGFTQPPTHDVHEVHDEQVESEQVEQVILYFLRNKK